MEELDGDTLKRLIVFLLLNLAAVVSLVMLDNEDRNLCTNKNDTVISQLSSTESMNTRTCLYYGGRTLHERKR
ncbi:hypothetical protein [Shewanella violacea]|uniref:Uncharacterized protein n=1 Tax=Shewanella violacea (strain JCM 10179 / CIP 106290 / LMG 19151 / DSS12) TaxID=637905 RepID=D4ZII1_SHEVD|nr:hypothetical protein [Shewanella violacea]BAJ01480.1 hypothetical protein SVI_1509 [Shewanella violacea DSS12]